MQPIGRQPDYSARRDSARSGSFSIKSRGGFSKFLRAQGRKTAEYVKDQDLYGQPVSLNYKGNDTFKTVPGGVISLGLKIVFILYSILKLKYMVVHQEWEITRQERVLTNADIMEEHQLKQEPNLSVGVHLNRKPQKLKRQKEILDISGLINQILRNNEHLEFGFDEDADSEDLDERPNGEAVLSEAEVKEFEEETTFKDMELLAKFLRVFGMIEQRQWSKSKPFKQSLNSDLYDWEEYVQPWEWIGSGTPENDGQAKGDEAGIYRMEVDLKDAVLKGLETDDPTILEVISRFQLRFDIAQMRNFSFTDCKSRPECGANLQASDEDMAKRVSEFVQTSHSSTGQDKASEAFDYFSRLHESKDPRDLAALRDAYYIEYQKVVIKRQQLFKILLHEEFLEEEKLKRVEQLKEDPHSAISEIDELFTQQVLSQQIQLNSNQQGQFDNAVREIKNANQVMEDYITQDKKFREELNIKIQKYNVELVVHDEVEAFKKHDDENFNYPFQNRSNKIASFTMDLDPFSETYEYPQEFLKFRKSFVCLEPNIFRQMLFFTDLAEEGITTIGSFFSDDQEDKEEIDEQLEEFCDSKLFRKIKYQSSKSTWKDYKDDYEPEVINGKILLEVILGLDSFKTEITRSSSQVLDFLGDIGGFYGALDLMVFVFGGYFSAKLFAASIAKTLYIQSRKKKDIARDEAAEKADERGASNFILEKIFSEDGDEGPETTRRFFNRQDTKKADQETLLTHMKKIRNQFSPIEFSSVRVVLDPILSSFFCCFSEEKLVKFPIFKRQKVLSKCENKLNNELEITSLLTRVRESYEMLQNLQTEQSKELLKFSKDKVIDLQDSNSSASEEEEEEEELPLETPGDIEDPPLNQPEGSASGNSSVCSSEYLHFTLPDQIRKAFDYSIVKGLALDAGERVDLLQKLKVFQDNQSSSRDGLSEKDNFSESVRSEEDLPDKQASIKVRKFESPRVMSSSSKQTQKGFVKSEGARLFNSVVCYDDVGFINPGAELKAKVEPENEKNEVIADTPGALGEVKTALANAEPLDGPVETNQVVLSGVAEPDNEAPSSPAPAKQLPEPQQELQGEPEQKPKEEDETPPS